MNVRDSTLSKYAGTYDNQKVKLNCNTMKRISTLLLFCIFVCSVLNAQSSEFLKRQKEAEAGDTYAQLILADFYRNGGDGVEVDLNRYKYWLTRSAEGGNEVAQFNLAYAYSGDDIFPQTNDIYEKWMRRSAMSGYEPACIYLGYYYSDISRQESIYWYKKAMDLYWEEYHKENEIASECLRKLGVYYHPEENHNLSSAGKSSKSASGSGPSSTNSSNTSGQSGISPDFYEISDTFFYKSGTYLMSSFSIMSLGPAGVQTYGDKKPEVVINGNKLIIKWNDGNISEKMFVSSKLMLPVYTLSGKEVKLPLYKLDNDRAVRAVKMKDSGNVYILEYVYNVNMKKYVHEFSYYLK